MFPRHLSDDFCRLRQGVGISGLELDKGHQKIIITGKKENPGLHRGFLYLQRAMGLEPGRAGLGSFKFRLCEVLLISYNSTQKRMDDEVQRCGAGGMVSYRYAGFIRMSSFALRLQSVILI